MKQPRKRALAHGVVAGLAGTLALSAWEPLRDGWLGQSAPYSVRDIARHGARDGGWAHRLAPRTAQRLTLLTRWLYGPAMGLVYAGVRPWISARARWGGLLLGASVGLFEQLTFPLLSVTRPPRSWSPAEHALLALQVLLYGAVTEAVLRAAGAEEA